MKELLQTILGPTMSIFTLIVILAGSLTCAGMLPGAFKREIAQARMLKTLRAEVSYYSTLIREASEREHARLWALREERERCW